MISKEYMDRLWPLPGRIFVERVEIPTKYGPILIPGSTTEKKRAMEAVVIRSADRRYSEGDRIILGGSAARFLGFGRDQDVLWWVITAQQIDAVLREPAEEGVEVGLEHELRTMTSERLEKLHDDRVEWDEGDPKGFL